MKYNHQINLLRRHCRERWELAARKYEQAGHQGAAYMGYVWADEMTYKLETLLEQDFSGLDHLQNTIRALMRESYDPRLKDLPNRMIQTLIRREEELFTNQLNALTPDTPAPEVAMPYRRILPEAEAREVLARIEAVWDWVPYDYWYPLRGEWKPPHAQSLFVVTDVAEPHWEAIVDAFCPEGERVYISGECAHAFWREVPYVAEGDRGYIPPCDACESVYVSKDFSRILYTSHEETVAFAGDWVPAVKEILAGERERWNKTIWAE